MNVFRIISYAADPTWHLERTTESAALCAPSDAAPRLTLVHQPLPDVSSLPLPAIAILAVTTSNVDICEDCMLIAEGIDSLDECPVTVLDFQR